MIYTITFNPALDYIVRLDHLNTGTINRTEQEYVLGGGKGINVSIVLNNLGMDTTALGFIAGFTGDEIVRQLNEFGVRESFIRLKEGLTRINVKVKHPMKKRKSTDVVLSSQTMSSMRYMLNLMH